MNANQTTASPGQSDLSVMFGSDSSVESLPAGATLGNYRLERLLGRGGMGAVYLAFDTVLRRKVALKLIDEAFESADSHQRLLHEARSAAALNHAGICTVYEVGQAEGVSFVAMEYVAGAALSERLNAAAPTPQQAVEWGIQAADALAYAHAHGVVHRDFKAGNAIVDESGRLKLVDFGLAQRAYAATEATATTMTVAPVGSAVGTPHAMAPEQVRGEATDARTDIWALGVLLYEMLGGAKPFAGKTLPDLFSSILHDTPAVLDAPGELRKIVARCLEKTPERRYQQASDVRAALAAVHAAHPHPRRFPWALAAVAAALALAIAFWSPWRAQSPPVAADVATPPRASIAVLPFINMSEDPGNEYFSDGISEELLNLLTKIPELRVIARTSSFSFKAKEVDIATVAEKLRVANVLEGSVRKSGNRVRIAAQLIRAADSSQLWSETYDRTLDDIFSVQDEIAAAVVAQLKIKLLGAAPTARKTDPAAYALFLKGRQLARLGTSEGWQQSNTLYQQALAIDSDYAAAWAAFASNYLWQADVGLLASDDGKRLAREAAAKALALDPAQAWAEANLGRIALTYDLDPAAAVRHYQRALTLEPANLDIIGDAGQVAAYIGRADQAIALSEYAVAHDPVNALAYQNLSFANLTAGHLDEAIAADRTALTLSPGSIAVSMRIGMALLLKGDAQAALAAIQQEPANIWRAAGLAAVYYALGQPTQSDAQLNALIERHEHEASYAIAMVFAYRGDADRAFAWLDKAIAYHDAGLYSIVVHQGFKNLHRDPRWLPFLRKIGMAPEQMAAIEFTVKTP